MNISSGGLDVYRSHQLSINMKTSSGDVITMDFLNEQSASASYKKGAKGSEARMSFSSMQSFQFSIESNGISEQDKKEIDAFMKEAKPFIDKFLKELSDDAPNSPVTKMAKEIVAAFDPSKERDENQKNFVKTNIVKLFDNALKEFKIPKPTTTQEDIEKLFENTQKLLEKTLKEFDEFNKKIYG